MMINVHSWGTVWTSEVPWNTQISTKSFDLSHKDAYDKYD